MSVCSKHEPLHLSAALNVVAVGRGPRLQKEISTSLLKGPIKPTTRAKERDNESIQRLWQAPSTQSAAAFCVTEVSPLRLICGRVRVFSGVVGPWRQSRSTAFVFVCVFGGFDWQQLCECSLEGMSLCVWATHTETHILFAD